MEIIRGVATGGRHGGIIPHSEKCGDNTIFPHALFCQKLI